LIETLNFWPSITLQKNEKKKEIQHNNLLLHLRIFPAALTPCRPENTKGPPRLPSLLGATAPLDVVLSSSLFACFEARRLALLSFALIVSTGLFHIFDLILVASTVAVPNILIIKDDHLHPTSILTHAKQDQRNEANVFGNLRSNI
jgi:hypothetical protein